MKRKYGVMIATWILWFISVLVPLFCMVLQRVPQRFLTIQFLVILLLGILLCVQWIWLRRAERIQNTAVRGEIEGAGMAALQSMTVPMILAERDGKILWSNAIFQNRFVSGRSVLGRSVQDVIHLNLAALDQNQREMETRAARAAAQGIPYTNYGVLIAYLNGILERSLTFLKALENSE